MSVYRCHHHLEKIEISNVERDDSGLSIQEGNLENLLATQIFGKTNHMAQLINCSQWVITGE